jgi:energy-coupling factor transport system substrate-specific component
LTTTDTTPEPATTTAGPAPARAGNRWRTVDIVVAAVIAVAFGVIFYAWDLAWNAISPAFDSVPWAGSLVAGVWFIPGVLSPLILRRPGSGVFTSTVAAAISALLGAQWGMTTILYGLLQGVGGEAPFAATGYRTAKLPVALIGGALSGLAGSFLDLIFYYQPWSAAYKIAYVAIAAASGLVIAGGGSFALTKALAGTGVLDRFPAGRSRAAI